MQNYIQNSKATETFCQEMIYLNKKKHMAEEGPTHPFFLS